MESEKVLSIDTKPAHLFVVVVFVVDAVALLLIPSRINTYTHREEIPVAHRPCRLSG